LVYDLLYISYAFGVWFALYGALDALAGEEKATTEDFVDVFRKEGGLDGKPLRRSPGLRWRTNPTGIRDEELYEQLIIVEYFLTVLPQSYGLLLCYNLT
jgi:hypothetical protein